MISTTSQYALRALARLAAEPDGGAVLGRELAQECEVPGNYLSKLLLQLKNCGLLETTRGSGGGYRLGRPPDQIRLAQIIEVFDPERVRSTCLLGQGDCIDHQEVCAAHEAWKGVKKTYLDFLNATTLAEISGNVSLSAFAANKMQAMRLPVKVGSRS